METGFSSRSDHTLLRLTLPVLIRRRNRGSSGFSPLQLRARGRVLQLDERKNGI